jgi:hypothetical protein
MYIHTHWDTMSETEKSSLHNFKALMQTCIAHAPDKNACFSQHVNKDFYFQTNVPFPLMNGVIGFSNNPHAINEQLEKLDSTLNKSTLPLTWIWPHNRAVPNDVLNTFKKHDFFPMGEYTNVAVSAEKIRVHTTNKNYVIKQVHTDDEFNAFMAITAEVFEIPKEGRAALNNLYGAYRTSPHIKLYLSYDNQQPVSTLLVFQENQTLGLYNGATRTPFQKQKHLSNLIIHALHNNAESTWVVSQLMAAQQAKRIAIFFNAEIISRFTPLCRGYDLERLTT